MVARIDMRPELVGHYAYNRIHGGVISAGLDAMGGLAVMAAIGAKHMGEPPEQRLHRFAKLGTIDLRIDYLRPGIGSRFELRAEVLRLELARGHHAHGFFGPDGRLMSAGAAAYRFVSCAAPRARAYWSPLKPYKRMLNRPFDYCFCERCLRA